MNVNQRNKLAMFMAVDHVFDTNFNKFKTIPALARFITDFKSLLNQIKLALKIQQGSTTGVRQLKLKEEIEMIEACVQVAGAMFVYAQVNKLPNLQAKCDISPTQLQRMPDSQLYVACLNIYEEAVKLGDNLSDYGKSAEQVSDLKKEIDDFAALIATPRSAIVTRSQATAELKRLIDEANDLLKNKIDKLMGVLKALHPKVYNTYKAARVIVDLRASKKVVEEE